MDYDFKNQVRPSGTINPFSFISEKNVAQHSFLLLMCLILRQDFFQIIEYGITFCSCRTCILQILQNHLLNFRFVKTSVTCIFR